MKLATIFLPMLVILVLGGCFVRSERERFAFRHIAKGIVNGTVHKGMVFDEIIGTFGRPSEITKPTVYNRVKSQILIYKNPGEDSSKAYYLYFRDDRLIEWKMF